MALRTLLIGAGARGREWAKELRSHSAWCLGAIVDVDRDALRSVAQDGVPTEILFDDADKALMQGRYDGVVVATPAEHHVAAIRWGLGAGLPVMVEKPFATSLSDAVALVRESEAKGLPLLVAQNYRYLRGQRAARNLVKAGTLGPIRQFVAQYYRVPHDMTPSLAHSSQQVLWGMAVHHLDTLRLLVGEPATWISAQIFSTDTLGPSRGATLHSMIEFQGGIRGVYIATYESRGHEYFEGGQEFYARLIGDAGSLHLFNRWLIHCPTGKLPRVVRRGRRAQTEESILLDKFADGVSHGVVSDCDGRENLQTMAILEGCVRSAENAAGVNPQELLNGLL